MFKKIAFITLIFASLVYLTNKYSYQKYLSYERIPDTGIFDEHDYPAVGLSFLRTGIPTGWSNMGIYKKLDDQNTNSHTIDYNGLSFTADSQAPSPFNKSLFDYPIFRFIDVDVGKGQETIEMVQPFLDHPPLGSLIFSLNSLSHSRFDQPLPSEYRYIAIITAILTGFLIFLFAFLIYRQLIIAYLSFIIYSTITTYVLISRYALFENLVIPFYLLSHIFLLLYLQKRKFIFLVISSVVIGLSYLVKEVSLFILLSQIAILFINKISKKQLILSCLPAIAIILSFYLYSYYLAPELTLKLLFDQAKRGFFGPLNLLYTIYQVRLHHFPIEGYWLWGVICLFGLIAKNFQKHYILAIGTTAFLFFFALMAGNNYPWYIFPITPFLVVASAYSLRQLIFSPRLANFLAFYFLPFSSSFYWGYFVYHPKDNLVGLYRYSLFLFFGAFTVFLLLKNKFPHLAKLLWLVFIGLILFFVYRWNFKSFIYIVSNWKQLPPLFTITAQ